MFSRHRLVRGCRKRMDGLGSATRSDTLTFVAVRCRSSPFAFSLRLSLRFRAILTASFYELRSSLFPFSNCYSGFRISVHPSHCAARSRMPRIFRNSAAPRFGKMSKRVRRNHTFRRPSKCLFCGCPKVRPRNFFAGSSSSGHLLWGSTHGLSSWWLSRIFRSPRIWSWQH